MGKQVITDRYEDWVAEWEDGLPTGHDLPSLSHPLIPRDLALAFKISPEPPYTYLDVNRASQDTLSSLRGSSYSCNATTNGCFNFKRFNDDENGNHRVKPLATWDHDMAEPESDELGQTDKGSDAKKSRRKEAAEAARTTSTENRMDDQSAEAKTLKRTRLVWTPQLHKRFVEVVAHLGFKNAVPKLIMQLMNVEGLTRENVASHLQKYRCYVKRMQGGLSNEAPSASDKLFGSMPVPPHSFNESSSGGGGSGHGNFNGVGDKGNHVGMQIPMPYPPPSRKILPTTMMGIGFAAHEHEHGHGKMRMPLESAFRAYESHSHKS
ncbi:Transcription factor LUX [Forsythia ovata]|uniref:Transcription factor LUX n=1 Tax=Forsythia ovata TaxID=205694 RepID=A0ABD1X6I7_9LAMI